MQVPTFSDPRYGYKSSTLNLVIAVLAIATVTLAVMMTLSLMNAENKSEKEATQEVEVLFGPSVQRVDAFFIDPVDPDKMIVAPAYLKVDGLIFSSTHATEELAREIQKNYNNSSHLPELTVRPYGVHVSRRNPETGEWEWEKREGFSLWRNPNDPLPKLLRIFR